MSSVGHTKEPSDDIVQRLRRAFNEMATCHCGNDMSGSGCDNHTPVWNPCPDSQLLSDARHEIERLRYCLAGIPDPAAFVEAARELVAALDDQRTRGGHLHDDECPALFGGDPCDCSCEPAAQRVNKATDALRTAIRSCGNGSLQ